MNSGAFPRFRNRHPRAGGIFLFAVLLAALLPAIAFAVDSTDGAGARSAPHPYAQIDLYADAGPVTIDAAFHEWFGPLSSGDHQSTDNHIALGLDWGSRQTALFYRFAESLDFNRDTAVLFHQQRNGGTLVPGSTYNVALDAKRFSALGLSWREAFRRDAHSEIAATVSAFRSDNLLDGRIRGQATVIDADSFSYNAQVDYRYDEDTLFDRPVRAPGGYGAALTIDGVFKLSPRTTLSVRLDDITSAIRWHDVPATTATASSVRTWVDNAGNPVMGPALSGNEYFLSGWTQRITPTGNIALRASITDNTSVTARFDAHLIGHNESLALTRRFASVVVGGIWYPSSGGFGLSVSLPQMRMAFSGDALSAGDAHWQRMQLDVGDDPAARHFDER